jgi:hypothetical protein
MFNSVEYIRSVCRQRKIPICQLEKDCGFANGYLHPKKLKKLPYDRAVTIANYLNLSVNMILTGEEEQKENPATISDEVDEVTMELMDIIQNGSDEDRQDLLEMYKMLKRRTTKKG